MRDDEYRSRPKTGVRNARRRQATAPRTVRRDGWKDSPSWNRPCPSGRPITPRVLLRVVSAERGRIPRGTIQLVRRAIQRQEQRLGQSTSVDGRRRGWSIERRGKLQSARVSRPASDVTADGERFRRRQESRSPATPVNLQQSWRHPTAVRRRRARRTDPVRPVAMHDGTATAML